MTAKVKGLVRRVERLGVEDGDVLLIHAGQQCTPEMLESFAATLNPWKEANGLDNVLIAIADPGLDLKALHEGDMSRLGWVRADAQRPEPEDALAPDCLNRRQLTFYLGLLAKRLAKNAETVAKQAEWADGLDEILFGSEAEIERRAARTVLQAIEWINAMPEGWDPDQSGDSPASDA